MKQGNSQYVQNLVNQAKIGRKNAFMELCEMNYEFVYSFAVFVFAEAEKSEEMTKKVFISAWESIKDARADIPFHIWIHGISVYTFMEDYRSLDKSEQRKRRTDLENFYSNKFPILISFYSASIQERLMFLLKEIEKYTYKEIADIFGGIDENEVKEKVRNLRWELAEGLNI